MYDNEPNRYKATMYWLKDVYIAQNLSLPFDEAYERERENVERCLRADETGNVAEIPPQFPVDKKRRTNDHIRVSGR